ncbi:hypothetical protein CLONEX_04006 [[Clostridium] nexile DSM 1787]|nr:hypothetical protein CLONEX_04006 [[Clostridium] nexile DSM 1787]
MYGDCTSTFKVRSTVALAEIFLTVSCRSLICYVLINFASYEQIDNCPKKGHKKIPPNLKTNSEGNLGYNKITHPNIVFFIW